MTHRIIAFLLMLFPLIPRAQAQQAAVGFCALDHTLEFKTANAGDKIALHLTRDLAVNEKILMPRGTALSATVVDVKNGNALSFVLDTASLKSGQEIPLIGIIAAVADPPGDLTQDPFYSMNRSTEPTQRTANTGSMASGTSGPASIATSGAATQTAILKGENAAKSNLHEDSSGAIGIDGLKLTWVLDKPPATTVMTAKKKNFKLPKGTEVLLRMAPPKL